MSIILAFLQFSWSLSLSCQGPTATFHHQHGRIAIFSTELNKYATSIPRHARHRLNCKSYGDQNPDVQLAELNHPIILKRVSFYPTDVKR